MPVNRNGIGERAPGPPRKGGEEGPAGKRKEAKEMGQELFSPLLGIAAMTGTILGFLIGWVVRRSRHAEEKQEFERLMRSYQELSPGSITLQGAITRKREIAS